MPTPAIRARRLLDRESIDVSRASQLWQLVALALLARGRLPALRPSGESAARRPRGQERGGQDRRDHGRARPSSATSG